MLISSDTNQQSVQLIDIMGCIAMFTHHLVLDTAYGTTGAETFKYMNNGYFLV